MDLGPDFIPKERYTTRAFTEVEYARLWPRTWQVACREEELPVPGDFVEYRIADQSILVVRAGADEIRAYYNSCRHRGTRLAHGCGSVADGQITCPFHGWRWNLDGSCAFVLDPDEFGLSSLDTPGLQLGELRCERRWGFVWICADPDAHSLDEHLSPLPHYFDPYHLEDMRFLWYRTTVLPTNWKATLDAFHEGYHNYGTHRQLLQWSDDTAMRYEQFANGHARYVTVRGAGPSKRFGLSPGEWDDRELLYQQVMHLGRSFEGGLYSEADMEAAEQLRTMEIPDGSSAAAEFSRLVAEHAAAGRRPLPGVDARATRRGHGRVLGVPQPGDVGQSGQLLHVPGAAERRRSRLVHLRHVGVAAVRAVGRSADARARDRGVRRHRRVGHHSWSGLREHAGGPGRVALMGVPGLAAQQPPGDEPVEHAARARPILEARS